MYKFSNCPGNSLVKYRPDDVRHPVSEESCGLESDTVWIPGTSERMVVAVTRDRTSEIPRIDTTSSVEEDSW